MSLCIIGLLLLTVLVFCRAPSFQFTNYDDTTYLIKNPYIVNGFTSQGVKWAFALPQIARSVDYSPFWRPLTYFSHMLDFQCFGLQAGAHHVTNLLLHLLNILLLFFILARTSSEMLPSFIAAALFAVHPLQVETVAWISARNTLISMFFALISTACYLYFVQKKSRLFYLLSVLCFAFCLSCKSTLVALPLIFLLLDYWPLKRAELSIAEKNRWLRFVLEKWPFLFLTFLASLLALATQPEILQPALSQSLINKIARAFFAYGFYLVKTFWPFNLTIFYPPITQLSGWIVFMCLLAGFFLLFITVISLACRRRYPFLFTGWFWFLTALFPASLLPQYADRYMYEPLVGIAILTAWSVWMLFSKSETTGFLVKTLTAAAVFFLAIASHIQTNVWAHSISLYQHVLKIYPDSFEARANLGTAFGDAGRIDDAIEQFGAAIKLSPNSPAPYENLGNAFFMKGLFSLSEQAFQKTLELDPMNANAWRMMGWFAQSHGNPDQALIFYSRALAIREDAPLTHLEIADLYQKLGKQEDAMTHYARTLNYDPKNAKAHQELQKLLIEASPTQQP